MTIPTLTTRTHLGDDQLLALVAGDLALEAVAELAAHAADCTPCTARLRPFARLDAALGGLAAAGGESTTSAVVDSPIGALVVTASERGIRSITFGDRSAVAGRADETPLLAAARRQLDEYFARQRARFALPLDPPALPGFQRQVLDAIADIPFGRLATYGEVARALHRPRAARAVGGALNRNPLPIVIPCHRVVGSTGALVGYAGGLDAKGYLLELEGARLAA